MLLKLGMQGPEVLNLERAVEAMGFEGVPIDGLFDEKLENVIKYIQKSHNLVVDGKVGDKTFALLDSLYQPDVQNFSSSAVVPEEDHPTIITDVTGPLATVHPIMAKKAKMVMDLGAQEGYTLVATQGRRTFPQQHKLFLQRPKVTNADAGQSYHNYGVAVDLAFVVNGKITWDDKYYKNIGRWANQVGLTWGGNWHFVDYPHIQLANMPAVSKMLAVYRMAPGGEEQKVQAVWNKFV